MNSIMPFPDICSFWCVLFTLEFKLTLLECETIHLAAIINKLIHAEIANCGELGDVSPENCTFVILFGTFVVPRLLSCKQLEQLYKTNYRH